MLFMMGNKSLSKTCLTFIIIFILIIIPLFFSSLRFTFRERLSLDQEIGINQTFLEIDGNAALSSYSGNGTKVNPCRIENISASGDETYGLFIKNIDVYFTLRNCTLSNFSYAIYFLNVTHGKINNNTITSGFGLYFVGSHNNTILNNTILCAGWGKGITFNNCHNNTILLNGIQNHSVNVFLVGSHHNQIFNNSLSFADCGIQLGTSDYNEIKNNTFTCTKTRWTETLCEGNIFENNTFIPCSSTPIPGFNFVFILLSSYSIVLVTKKIRKNRNERETGSWE